MKHRFSIVIPAREHARTLPYTLQTCLAQEFDDFEIIVADNFSSSPTRQVVMGIADERIRYARSDRLLAMSDSWEFALSQASGEYIILIGADDGLLLHALPEIDRLLRMLGAPVLRWESVCYNWPDLPVQDHQPPNALLIPLKQANDYYAIHRRDSTAMIQAAANSRVSYAELPMLYCSAIHHSLIDRLRTWSGRVINSQCPDIYSSFAFARLTGSYHSVAAPMGINGLSGNSNGVACIYLKEQSPVAQEFRNLNTQANYPVHPLAPDVPVMSAYVADSFLHARDTLFPDEQALTLDRKQLAVNCVNEALCTDEEEWQRFRAAIRRSLADDAELLAWFEREYAGRLLSTLKPARHKRRGYGCSYMNLDASDFGVTNIFEAAQFCEKLLGYKREGLNCHVAPETTPSQPSAAVTTPALRADAPASGVWRRLRKAARTLLHG
jgi:hypothetical protein